MSKRTNKRDFVRRGAGAPIPKASRVYSPLLPRRLPNRHELHEHVTLREIGRGR